MRHILSRDERRLQRCAAQMVIMLTDCMVQGFSYDEGMAMFKTMADMMQHINDTGGDWPDEIDIALIVSKLKAHLEANLDSAKSQKDDPQQS